MKKIVPVTRFFHVVFWCLTPLLPRPMPTTRVFRISRCCFSTILFNDTICAYNSCIFLFNNNHSYPYRFYRTWIWGQWSTLKVIVKNNFEIFKKFKK